MSIPKALDDLIRQSMAAREEHARLAREAAAVDAGIERLQRRRIELGKLRQEAHPKRIAAEATANRQAFAIMEEQRFPMTRRLEVAVLLAHSSKEAQAVAITEGRRLLGQLDGEPLLCVGYLRLAQHGMWYGGQTLRRPSLTLRANRFCVSIPVISEGRASSCNIDLRSLARLDGERYAPDTQVAIGEAEIVTYVRRHRSQRVPDERDIERLNAVLLDAGFSPEKCSAILAA